MRVIVEDCNKNNQKPSFIVVVIRVFLVVNFVIGLHLGIAFCFPGLFGKLVTTGCHLVQKSVRAIVEACATTTPANANTIQSPLLDQARQMILVVSPEWGSVYGELRRYDRKSGNSKWQQEGEMIKVVLGGAGLAWPDDIRYPAQIESDPIIRHRYEGRSPAGIFALGQAFGYYAHEQLGWLNYDYRQATRDLVCVNDDKSIYYNQVVDSYRMPSVDWDSDELMDRSDDLYSLGVVINPKCSAPSCGKTPCTFLHIWQGDGVGTTGSTAMSKADMLCLLQWLDREMRPVIVQITKRDRSWIANLPPE